MLKPALSRGMQLDLRLQIFDRHCELHELQLKEFGRGASESSAESPIYGATTADVAIHGI